jgi:hypothetical protein
LVHKKMDREGNEVRSAMNWRYFGVLRVQESPAQREPGGIAKRKLGRFSSKLEEAEEGPERSMARSRTQRTGHW